MAKESYKDPFPNLRPPRLFAAETRAEPMTTTAEPNKVEKAKAALAGATPAKSKRGRPVKVADSEPWKAEGVSRMTWYRRQKKEKPE
jgi:hypothetical protein